MRSGKWNVSLGLLSLAGFMLYGFVLIYLRDFAPGKEDWIAAYSTGTHFEARLAHVHGNLFAVLNVMIGYLLLRLPITRPASRWISVLGLVGMLMPVGILAEIVLGAPPLFVVIGGVSMTLSVAWLGLAASRIRDLTEPVSGEGE